jgi:hypothetical protein
LSNLNLGLVGNGQISALIDDKATVVWSCLPQFDADPTFCRLLRDDAEKDLPGFFEVEVLDYSHSEQEYITNTAILQTTLYDSNGGAVRVESSTPTCCCGVSSPCMAARGSGFGCDRRVTMVPVTANSPTAVTISVTCAPMLRADSRQTHH